MLSSLSSLYEQNGYNRFKMSKFEEYDLYVKNKDFLISDNIITFNDIGGKLLALKPDVTLSIVKNVRDEDTLKKVYYNENVYRVSGATGAFKEIMQVGLECIGDIDTYLTFEVISLAVKSLLKISEASVLDLSDLKVLSALLDKATESAEVKKQIFKLIGTKSAHEMDKFSGEINPDYLAAIKEIALLSGSPDAVLGKLKDILNGLVDTSVLSDLESLCALLKANSLDKNVRIDFSVVNDIKYYNGIVFKGFVSGISKDILSGGRYDNLLYKMGKAKGAIGFAIYLDLLEDLQNETQPFDIDAAVLYDENSDLVTLSNLIAKLNGENLSATAIKSLPEKLKCRKVYKINGSEVSILENNA